MYGLGPIADEYQLNQGSLTREVLDASIDSHYTTPTLPSGVANTTTTTTSSPASQFSNSNLGVPLSSLHNTQQQEILHSPNNVQQSKIEPPPLPSTYNPQLLGPHMNFSDGHHLLHSSLPNIPVRPASPLPSSHSAPSSPPQSLPSIQNPMQLPLPPHLMPPLGLNSMTGANHPTLPPPPAPPPSHQQQHDLSTQQHQLSQQQPQDGMGQVPTINVQQAVNGDQQVNAFIMQQLYQQYILYLQNEITCLRSSQLSPPQPHHFSASLPSSPTVLSPTVLSPRESYSSFPHSPPAAATAPTSPVGSPPTIIMTPPTIAVTPPAISVTPPITNNSLSATNSPALPRNRMLKNSSRSISAPNLRHQPYSVTTTPSSPQPQPHHQQPQQQQPQQQPQQKPMKFHLVQYSKQPTVEEFEARAGCSPPDSPACQSATINKLQIHPELLTMKQSEAARILGISPSMLSKRWREAMNGRKWPYRVHRKLQKEINSIVTLMDDTNPTPPTNPPPKTEPPVLQQEDMERRLKLMSVYKDNPTYI